MAKNYEKEENAYNFKENDESKEKSTYFDKMWVCLKSAPAASAAEDKERGIHL